MRWKTNPFEGWQIAFAWFPTQLDDGTTVWLENFRYYVTRAGFVMNRLPIEEK